jgi:hypothetical protein
MKRRRVTVSDLMQREYTYVLMEPVRKNFDPAFRWRRKGWLYEEDPRGWFSGIAATTWAADRLTMNGK